MNTSNSEFPIPVPTITYKDETTVSCNHICTKCKTDISEVKNHTHIEQSWLTAFDEVFRYHLIMNNNKTNDNICVCVKCAIEFIKELGRWTVGIMEDGYGNPVYVSE